MSAPAYGPDDVDDEPLPHRVEVVNAGMCGACEVCGSRQETARCQVCGVSFDDGDADPDEPCPGYLDPQD